MRAAAAAAGKQGGGREGGVAGGSGRGGNGGVMRGRHDGLRCRQRRWRPPIRSWPAGRGQPPGTAGGGGHRGGGGSSSSSSSSSSNSSGGRGGSGGTSRVAPKRGWERRGEGEDQVDGQGGGAAHPSTRRGDGAAYRGGRRQPRRPSHAVAMHSPPPPTTPHPPPPRLAPQLPLPPLTPLAPLAALAPLPPRSLVPSAAARRAPTDGRRRVHPHAARSAHARGTGARAPVVRGERGGEGRGTQPRAGRRGRRPPARHWTPRFPDGPRGGGKEVRSEPRRQPAQRLAIHAHR
ncbi:hypothetical protein I4F81_006681 [Pyropia yezoensis]|uniref:Uncharacterized protein n=1 Tax=Pyropia yezoensis TaxID=2788 RepID=A0ACC3C2F0_PYRYE|nr:hypothetical protein I4F81_006681 [Neopyropia yezoensis]